MSLRSFIKARLLKRDMILSRPPGQYNMAGYKLAKARDRGLKIGSAIDGGAANGGWSTELREIWPQAKILCVEPRDDVQGQLRTVQAQLGNIEISQALLGPQEGEADFYLDDDRSSMNKDFVPNFGTVKRLPVTTLDNLVQRTGFEGPDLIKLDLQGAELSVLQGAGACLKRAIAIQLEVSFIDFHPGMPLIADVFAFLRERNFVPYDILGLWHRPLDGAMAQGDVLFLRADSPLRSDRRYSSTSG
jgi:FkbM family methyltransferase